MMFIYLFMNVELLSLVLPSYFVLKEGNLLRSKVFPFLMAVLMGDGYG